MSTVGIWALDWLAWLNLTRRSTEPGSMLPSRFKGGWHFLHAKYPRHFFGWSRFSVSMLGCWDALVSISPQLVHVRSLPYHATYSAVDRVLVGVLVRVLACGSYSPSPRRHQCLFGAMYRDVPRDFPSGPIIPGLDACND